MKINSAFLRYPFIYTQSAEEKCPNTTYSKPKVNINKPKNENTTVNIKETA